MKNTKQERKNEAWKECEKIQIKASEEYSKICNEIDAEPETKCPHCGK